MPLAASLNAKEKHQPVARRVKPNYLFIHKWGSTAMGD